jgi:predicted RNase H-like HicB family nuclease
MTQNDAKFRLNMILIENQESKKFTAYFTQFPEIIVDGLTQNETEINLIKTLGYFLDFKTEQNSSEMPKNHVIRKTIDFNYEEA